MKSRLIVKYIDDERSSFVNVPADRILEEGGIITAYDGDEIVGMFDLSVVMVAYLSKENEK